MIESPVFDASSFKELITLEDTVYQITLTWNGRDEAWALSIAEQDGTPILTSIKVIPGYELIKRFKDTRLPQGALFAADMTDTGNYPTRDNLGTDVKLIYMTEAELNAAV